MSKDIVVTNPRLVKFLKWFENQSAVVKSFFISLLRFGVAVVISTVGLSLYFLGGPTALGLFIAFLGIWFLSYREMRGE